jgi:hypothetical protein
LAKINVSFLFYANNISCINIDRSGNDPSIIDSVHVTHTHIYIGQRTT